MGCIAVLLALISPRLALFFIWVFSDLLGDAYDEWWLPLLGLLPLAVDDARLRGDVGLGRERGDRLRVVHRRARVSRRHQLVVAERPAQPRLSAPIYPSTSSAAARTVATSPPISSVVTNESRHASRSWRILSRGPISDIWSMSSNGIAAAASCLRPDR